MKNNINIKKLSELARIDVRAEEAQKLQKDITSILGYVQQVQEVSGDSDTPQDESALVNVLREDGDPHESGIYTPDLMREVPKKTEREEGTYVEVTKIL